MPDATDEGKTVENALLYKRVILLEVQAIKYCAALECATGVPWDQVNIIDLDGREIMEMVAQNIARGLNISVDTARERVALHYATANPTQIETPSQG